MTNYLKDVYGVRETPQSEPIPGTSQVSNSAGGYAFPVDCWTRLERFLILGSEGGSYYARERRLTVENARAVAECMAQDYRRAIDTIVAISENGRAPSNDPVIFALAMGLGAEDPQARRYAAQRLDRVCRISTHLFHLCKYVQQFRGWGRSLRRAVQQWYHKRGEDELVYQLAKYRQRDGWSHRDVLRKCHLPDNSAALRWAIGAGLEARTVARHSQAIAAEYEGTGALPRLIEGYQQAHRCQSGVELARVIRAYGLTHEMVPNHLKDQVEVWEALFERMPMTAMIRNLGKMSNIGLLKPLSEAVRQVCQRLSAEKIRQARIHPLAVLMAGRTYQQGHGLRGSLQWEVVPQIVEALEEAFYAAFANVEPTFKRTLLGIDVSGSMTVGQVAGTPLTPVEAAATLAMVTARTELEYHICGFSHEFRPLNISTRDTLEEAIRKTRLHQFGRTDCALPMRWAEANQIAVDTFVVYTDNETWCGQIHPVQALRRYRERMGIAARLVVVGMVSNGFSIADPNDAGMLDVVGFDAAVPQLIADFARD